MYRSRLVCVDVNNSAVVKLNSTREQAGFMRVFRSGEVCSMVDYYFLLRTSCLCTA